MCKPYLVVRASVETGVMEEFRRRYNRRYGAGAAVDGAIEARTFVVRGVGNVAKPSLQPAELGAPDPSAALVGHRDVFFRDIGGFESTPVYRRELLLPGNRVAGHAVIEAVDTTILVHPGQLTDIDRWGNVRFGLLEKAEK